MVESMLTVANIVGGEPCSLSAQATFVKRRPADGAELCAVPRSTEADVASAVDAARSAQPGWAHVTAVERGRVLRELALRLQDARAEAVELVVAETGKAPELALGEADAAVEMGFFVASEGRRLYGRTTTSAMSHRTVLTLRQPVGVAALIVSFN